MKTLVSLILIIAAVGCHAQLRPDAYEWKATLRVVDELGEPVQGARAWVSFSSPEDGKSTDPFQRNDWAIAGLTDTNGVFVGSHRDRAVFLGFHAEKSGHYSAWVQHDVGFSPKGRPEKLNPSVTLVLKRIISPIPMYAKWVNLKMPRLGSPVGFDLTAGEWVAPYGKGILTDILFTADLDKRAENDWESTLKVSFPNKGDGIQTFPPTSSPPGEGSALRSPHEAPEEGYGLAWGKREGRRPSEPSRYTLDERLNFFFRVRTVLDEQGKIRSALYGKIYGDFMNFRYYLNPTPNSRNVEFDPSKNLLRNLQPTERVRQP